MTCSKNDLIGLFNTLEKDEEKIDALNEQIKVIKNGPQGINAEIKAFAKTYEANEKDVKVLNKPYKKLPECFVVEVKNSREATDLILKHSSLFVDYEIVKGKMDDVFLTVTGKSLEQGGDNA
jgi:predicted  nucleic acid-binding Zn-ribbon protein